MSNVSKPPGSTIPSPPLAPPGPGVPADLLDAYAQDVSEQLSAIEDATAALRQLAASMQRESDRAKQGRAP